MEVYIMASSQTMRFQDEENTNGMMERFMKDNGSKIRCMGLESLVGLMVNNMKESLRMIRDMEMEPSNGRTERSTKVLGISENSMERESSSV